MIDFTGVKAITIPEGSVKKITRGSTVLWEKPTVSQGYIVVFPETTLTGSYNEAWDFTDFYITLNRKPSIGEKYVTVVNGQEKPYTASDNSGQIMLYDSEPYFSTDGTDTFNCYLTFEGNVPTITLEVRYIPD